MSVKKGLLKGSKFNKRHSTIIDDAIKLIARARSVEQISKIVIGLIKPITKAERRIKFTPVPSGLKMDVRGNTAIQTFYIYTSSPVDVQNQLQETWNKLN